MKNFYIMTRWTIVNAIFVLLAIAGFTHGIEGARNITVFIVYFMLLFSLTVFIKDIRNIYQQSAVKNPRPTWYLHMDRIFDLAVTCFFLWYGEFWLATMYVIQIFAILVIHGKKTETTESIME